MGSYCASTSGVQHIWLSKMTQATSSGFNGVSTYCHGGFILRKGSLVACDLNVLGLASIKIEFVFKHPELNLKMHLKNINGIRFGMQLSNDNV